MLDNDLTFDLIFIKINSRLSANGQLNIWSYMVTFAEDKLFFHLSLLISCCYLENSDAHWTDILGSEFMLVLCGGGFLMSLIRVSSADWGQLYLMEERGLSTYNAGGFAFSMEVGGAIGTTVIGALADFAIKKV